MTTTIVEELEPDLHLQLGLTDEELMRIAEILGRSPNRAELAMYSVMWSEHCSYKSSRIHLAKLPTEGPYVLIGPGEGAGVIKVGEAAVALRLESHNHPSFVEPVQGAATGIGGIVRDVLSMGARPIALLDPLRFGPLPSEAIASDEVAERNRVLVEGVISGISSYGNCIGVPTVGGEIKFEDCYSGNPLVNVMCIGVAKLDGIKLARAHGPGNAVLLLGSLTGRDGIGGVSVLASATFDSSAEDKRPSVQVGDPFTEKLLIEACLELMELGIVVGVQDLGGAGLCCATSESAASAGTGMRIDISRVPARESSMEPFEILTSESQERMLVICEPADVARALAVCEKWGLPAAVIGEVTDNARLEVFDGGQLVADVPAASLGDGPVYSRPIARPEYVDRLAAMQPDDGEVRDPSSSLMKLISSPNIASKKWAWEQYDHQVMLGTVVRPGRDACILRIPGTSVRLAVTTDGNGRYGQLDPALGAAHTVAEAARNLSVMGALPVAITNCLNFGSPERPEVMWQFAETIRGMSEACTALATPVTGGNVSFYNESTDQSIYPTPVVGMVGLLAEDVEPPPMGFVADGDHVVLLGTTLAELGGSEYSRTICGRLAGKLPALDLAVEERLQKLVRDLVAKALVRSSHDLSEGGLGVALVEACCEAGVGCEVDPDPTLALHEWLFSESASRVLISVSEADLPSVQQLASSAGVPFVRLGVTGGSQLIVDGMTPIPVESLVSAYDSGFALALGEE